MHFPFAGSKVLKFYAESMPLASGSHDLDFPDHTDMSYFHTGVAMSHYSTLGGPTALKYNEPHVRYALS